MSANKQYIIHIEKTEDWNCCNKKAKRQITLTLSNKSLSGIIHIRFVTNAGNIAQLGEQ